MEKEEVLKVLDKVTDPELGISIVKMGMISEKNIEITDNEIKCNVELTTPACPLKNNIKGDVEKALNEAFGEKYKIKVQLTSSVRNSTANSSYLPSSRMINLDNIKDVKNIIAVYSCKGGVGKSTVSVNLALSLAKYGANVGLLDLDLHGPNIPLMLGLVGQPKIRNSKIVPPEVYGMKVLSVGLLVDNSSPIIWRGPIQSTAVKQLFEDVNWDNIDYLVLDLPPGTGDIHITLSQNVPISGIVSVSTPQLVAIIDTVKGVNLFEKMGISNLGIVINMSYYICQHCGEKNYIFPRAELNKMIEDKNLPILAELPIDPKLAELSDKGIPIVEELPESETTKIFLELASKVASSLSVITVKKSLQK
ncbi:MAG: Mrp/NBP35 family ATP-binding protein [Brevinematia bacterium]